MFSDNSKQVPYGQTGHVQGMKIVDLLSPLFESEFEMYHQRGNDPVQG